MIQFNTTDYSVSIKSIVLHSRPLVELLGSRQEKYHEAILEGCINVGAEILLQRGVAQQADWLKQTLGSHHERVIGLLDLHAEKIVTRFSNDLNFQNEQGVLRPVLELIRETKVSLEGHTAQAVTRFQENQQALLRQIEEGLSPNFRESYLSQFKDSMLKTLQDFSKGLDPGYSESVLAQFEKRLETQFLQESADPARPSPWQRLREDFAKELKLLRDELRQATIAIHSEKAIDAVTPAKGAVFEDAVLAALGPIAEARNDLVTSVGAQPGRGTSKCGDFVYLDDVSKKSIVIEAKDLGNRIRFSEIEEYMDRALTNRQAAYGIYVVKNDEILPTGIGRFHITAKFIVCAFSMLEPALKFSIAKVQASAGSPDALIDVPKLIRLMEEVEETATRLSATWTAAQSAQKAITKVAKGIDVSTQALTRVVEEAWEVLRRQNNRETDKGTLE
ncbi:MAG: hypothetical protein JNL01_03150 [Bdellovibrionales bacterium]|nr:hypothetical protein [Bdellovibrionales bacterium]